MLSIPHHERPRERLLREGSDALKTSELLAILLGHGVQGTPVLALAEQVLSTFGDLPTLVSASIPELMQIKGIGPVKAIELHACFALAKRFLAHSHQERSPISSAKEAYLYLRDLFYQESQECLGILLLDTRLRPLHRELVHRGTIDSVLADPRIIFSKALKHHASALIVAHNHPSNDPTPSAQDLVLTKRLQECGALLGIPLKDHLIITATTYHSMSFLHNDKGNEM